MCIRDRGKTLLRRALEAVPASCFARVAVVTQYPQGMELAREMGFLPVENSRPDLGLSHTIALGMAVSYTHLDVYKRQIQTRGAGGLQNGGALRHGDGSVVDGQRYHLMSRPPLKMP